jgi:hypothetical protein
MECAGCGAELTGRQRKWCSTECCRQNAYAQQLKKAVPDRFCRHCNKQLAGRQSVWCSLACKRDHETELALVDGIETHVRKCKTCGLMKPLAVDFYKTANGRYRRDCRACVMASNDNRNANPDAADKARNYHLKSLYDITADEYEEILAAQGGRCAVCGKPPIKQRLGRRSRPSHRPGSRSSLQLLQSANHREADQCRASPQGNGLPRQSAGLQGHRGANSPEEPSEEEAQATTTKVKIMSLFRRNRTLHQRHAAAHSIGQDALSVFHVIAEDLELSAAEHRAVGNEANTQINELVDLVDNAFDAAVEAEKRAAVVRSLVG